MNAPYLFQEMNDEPPKRRHTRVPSLAPGLRAALNGLKETLNAIPEAEWELRRRRWNDLQRDLKNARQESGREDARKRSAALDPPEAS